eukprot:g41401.t1
MGLQKYTDKMLEATEYRSEEVMLNLYMTFVRLQLEYFCAEDAALDGVWSDYWILRFLVNLAGYATIIIPGYLLVQYFKKSSYLET